MNIIHDPDEPLNNIRRLLEQQQQLVKANTAITTHMGDMKQWASAYEASTTLAQTAKDLHGICQKIWGKYGAGVYQTLLLSKDSKETEYVLRHPWEAGNLHHTNPLIRLASMVANQFGAFGSVNQLAEELHPDQIQAIPALRGTMRKLEADKEKFKTAMAQDHVKSRITARDQQSFGILMARLDAEMNNTWHAMCGKGPLKMERPENPTPAIIDEHIAAFQVAYRLLVEHQQNNLNNAMGQLPQYDPASMSKKTFDQVIAVVRETGMTDVTQSLQKWGWEKIGTQYKGLRPTPPMERSKAHRHFLPQDTTRS